MSSINAKEELETWIKILEKEKEVQKRVAYGKILNDRYSSVVLAEFYSHQEFEEALSKLDFKYDNGYGGQYLFGYVVFEDGSWLERHEYDGSEWWEYKETPSLFYVKGYTHD